MRFAVRSFGVLGWFTLAVVVVAVPGARAQSKNAAVEQELREAVQKYMAGYASNTVEGYFQNYATDITMWWPNGVRMAREAYHQNWTETLAGGNTVVSAVADDVRVQAAPSGDAGVASFAWKISRKNGNPYDLATSATFFKRGGTWQIVHMHFNRIGPPTGRGGGQGQGAGRGAGQGQGAGRGGQAPPAPAAQPASAAPQPALTGAALEVQKTIADLNRAYGANDLATYFSIYAPDLTAWVPSGRLDRESYRKAWTESVQKTGGLASAESSDVRIQVSPGGDLAVASHLLKVKRKTPGPDWPENVTYEISPTLIKRNGAWTIVHTHIQIVPEPRSGG